MLFDGKEIMKPEELEVEDSVMVSFRSEDSGKKVICDKIRKWKGRYVSVMVLENQTYVDYRMVLRVMEAEVMGYDKQRKEVNRKNHEAGIKLSGNEYPSGMRKGQKLIPMITLVLYLGKKSWDGARSLYEMLELDDELKPFVNNFKLNLFDYHEWKEFSRFKTENRLLFEALSYSGDKKKMQHILQANLDYRRLDMESAKAIKGLLKLKTDLNTIKTKDEEGKAVYNMCKAFDDHKEEGRREGEIQTLKTVIKNLMNNQKITFEAASEMLGISKKKQKKLRTLI